MKKAGWAEVDLMQPHLIVDIRTRTLVAQLLAFDGSMTPCVFTQHGITARYISTDFWVDAKVFKANNRYWSKVIARQDNVDEPTLRSLGVLRTWEILPEAEVLPLHFPWSTLFSSGAFLTSDERQALDRIAAGLLDTVLDPLFQSPTLQAIEPEETAVVVIVSAFACRQIRLLLQREFRICGFRRVTLVHRESAAAMAMLAETSGSTALVIDSTQNDLHLHKVVIEFENSRVLFRTVGSRTLHGLGWSRFLERIGAALALQGGCWKTESPGAAIRTIDQALRGLIGGPFSPKIPSEPPCSISYGSVENAFGGEPAESLAYEFLEQVLPAVKALQGKDAVAIPLGTLFMFSQVEEILLNTLEIAKAPAVGPVVALERCAYGVRSCLRWLDEAPCRSVKIFPAAGLSINTLRGELLKLLPAEGLPQTPNRRNIVRQVCLIQGEPSQDATLVVSLLWGNDPDPESNVCLCTFPLKFPASPKGGPPFLEFTLDILRSACGRRLSGSIHATLGESTVTSSLKPWRDAQAISCARLTAPNRSIHE